MQPDLPEPARPGRDGILIEIKFLPDKSINSMAFILREAGDDLFKFLYKIKSCQHFYLKITNASASAHQPHSQNLV